MKITTDLNTESTQEKILDALAAIPPLSAYLHALTPDEEETVKTVRDHFRDIAIALSAFFTGKSNPFSKNYPNKKMIDLELDYYLSFYELIWWGWDEIQAEVKSSWHLTQESGIPPLANKEFPKTPGDTLVFLFQLDCYVMLYKPLNGGRINSHESQNILRHGLPKSTSIGLKKKREKRTQREAEEIRQSDNFIISGLREYCLSAIKKRLRGLGKTRLREKIKGFEDSHRMRSKGLASLIKTQGVKGVYWQFGTKIFLH